MSLSPEHTPHYSKAKMARSPKHSSVFDMSESENESEDKCSPDDVERPAARKRKRKKAEVLNN
jgi:hypothetical protein